LVLSTDHHLTDEGFGHQDWLASVMLLGELTELDQMVWGGTQFAYLSTVLPMLGVWKLGTRLAKSKLGITAMLAFAAGGFLFRSELKDATMRAGERATPTVDRTVAGVTAVFEQLGSAQVAYQSRLVLPSGPTTLQPEAARLFAARARPVTSEDVYRKLVVGRRDLTLAEVRAMLRGHPAFVGQRGKGYKLGCLAQHTATNAVNATIARI
jgi:hypothetical protein